MKRVLEAIEQDNLYRIDIEKATGLQTGQVRSAIFNLTFIGAIQRAKDNNGKTVYFVSGKFTGGVAPCLRGIRSIFEVALPQSNIRQLN